MQIPVLLADDSADDRFFVRRALGRSESLKVVGETCDGMETIAYLTGAGKFSNRQSYPFPRIVVLDINMPRIDGFGVLSWLQNRNFPDLRIVMYSDSLAGGNSDKAIGLGADVCRGKTSDVRQLREFARQLEELARS